MIIPHVDPGEVLVRSREIGIGTVLKAGEDCPGEAWIPTYLVETCTIVIEGEDLARRQNGSLVDSGNSVFVLVDIVAEMDLDGERWDIRRFRQDVPHSRRCPCARRFHTR